jgi:hypothetical protein
MITLAVVICVILASGLVGGYTGYLLGPPDPYELPVEKRNWYVRRSLILGIVAAFMVPLFLELVGAASGADKNLVDHLSISSTKFGGWLVFAGFCLVASISGQRFILAMSKKLFDDLFKKVKGMEQNIEDLEEDLTEVSTGQVDRTDQISDLSKTVLKRMYASSERRPRREDISKLGPWTEEELDKALEELEADGLVRSKEYDGIKRWRVRSVGKRLLALLHKSETD